MGIYLGLTLGASIHLWVGSEQAMAYGLPGYGLSKALSREVRSGAESQPSCEPKCPIVGPLPPEGLLSL